MVAAHELVEMIGGSISSKSNDSPQAQTKKQILVLVS